MTRVAIIGGGIGGLTAANALSRAGIEVGVYEAAAEPSAYIISCHGTGLWIAQRRDTRETPRGGIPLGLRDKIIADYTARPVSRDLPGRALAE